MRKSFLALSLLFAATTAAAAPKAKGKTTAAAEAPATAAPESTPDLSHQEKWTDKDKQDFLQYLRSGTSLPADGQVRDTGEAGQPSQVLHKARFATLELATDDVMTVAGNGSILNESATVGPKLLVGTHVFSWVRLYGGAMYTRFRQGKLDGSRASVDHVQLPLGVELALVPLGTPQTRYVILRGGVALHEFSSRTVSSDFRTPLIGWQASYNAGLGYEWQFEQSPWRIHALAEGYKSMMRHGSSARFYGLGLSLGAVYTF